ncbi:MAG: UDP-N-acetylmuramate dehydrogenase, partial [Oscillospiraceae bacterium]
MQSQDNISCEIVNRAKVLGCRCFEKEMLKNHVSFKVGGPCSCLISINSAESIAELALLCEKLNAPYMIIGKGSNLLIDDNGFDGVVFLMGKDFSQVRLLDETTIECEAGAPLSKAAYFAYKSGLTGFEFAWGIPGTVGGAVYMNAGAYGGEIKDIILSAEYSDKDGKISVFQKNELDLSYRNSVFQCGEYVITKSLFKLEKGEPEKIRQRMDELLQRRKEKQPLEFPSAGSTFKRPDGAFAALLIEQCGLKGLSVGGAQVSTKHSGFVINKNNASYSDIIALIHKVKEIVYEKTGYQLECEVEIISSKNS